MKFSPSESKLLRFYLYNHIHGKLREHHYRIIPRRDLYGTEEPWDMWQRLQSGEQPGDVYAFTTLKKKVILGGGTSKRAGRKVGKITGGRWHGEDTGTRFDLVLKAGSKEEKWIGMRKRFNYKNNDPSFGEHKKWILHEFSLRKDGCRDEEGTEVVCMIRKNKSLLGNAVAEAGKPSVLEGKKRKIKNEIDWFLSGKRVYSSDPAAPLEMTMLPPQQQQPALPSAVVVECSVPATPLSMIEQQPQWQMQQGALMECSYPAAPMETTMMIPQQLDQQAALPSTVVDWSNAVAPLAMMEQPQPVQGGREEESFSPLDITSYINFDIPENFQWGDLGGTLEANQANFQWGDLGGTLEANQAVETDGGCNSSRGWQKQ